MEITGLDFTFFRVNLYYNIVAKNIDALEVGAMVKKLIGKLRLILFAGVCCLPVTSSAYGEVILEYITPTPESSPADLAFDDQGNLWFTELNGNRIGKLVPSRAKSLTSQGITEYELPHPNSKPNYLTIAKNGMIWFTELGGNRIGSLDPKNGWIKEYEIPTPHSQPHEIIEAPDGAIWFLEFQTNKIGRLEPANGRITEYPIGPGNPHDLVIADDKIWYTQGGMFWVNTFSNKLGSLDIKTGAVEVIRIPPEKSVPYGLTLAEDGALWFTQLLSSKLARYDRSRNKTKIVEYPLSKGRKPRDLRVHENQVWFTASEPDAIGVLDLSKARPGTGQGVKYYELPDPESHPTQITLDKQGNIWFTEPGDYFQGKYNNKIGLLVP